MILTANPRISRITNATTTATVSSKLMATLRSTKE
jgi:hypothetical protein